MSFEKSLKFVLEREGGYSNNPLDAGKATNFGITQATYHHYRDRNDLVRQSVKYISQPEVKAIYQTDYWQPAKCNIVEGAGKSSLALVSFDWAVNGGVSRSLAYTQASLNVIPDGVWGEKTLDALAQKPEKPAVAKFLRLRALFHRARTGDRVALALLRKTFTEKNVPHPDESQVIFLEGWLARLRWNARASEIAIDPLYEQGSHKRPLE